MYKQLNLLELKLLHLVIMAPRGLHLSHADKEFTRNVTPGPLEYLELSTGWSSLCQLLW